MPFNTPSRTVRERQDAGLARARDTWQDESARRAVNDPVKLARAAKIVRAALARQALTLADLTPLPDPHHAPTPDTR